MALSQSVKDRPCDACGGGGCGSPFDWHREIHAARRRLTGRVGCRVPCLVCQGAGRISDAMPVKDALADAETLRLNVTSELPPGQRWSRALGTVSKALAEAEWFAVVAGGMARKGIRAESAAQAAAAARAAFSAVPGLRGE
jgi:hypothetical protein